MNRTVLRSAGFGFASRSLAAAAIFSLAGGVSAVGCLDRPVVPGEPTLKTNFTSEIKQQAVTKVDLLFMIDNSASMGDKQAYLKDAVPDLINRLVNPNCVSTSDGVTVLGASSNDGSCAAFPNSEVEFPPVHDMHIGLISSSLGGRGGDVCPTTGPNSTPTDAPFTQLSDHNDDQAHLLSRSLTITTDANGNPTAASEGTVGDAANGFLAWFPSVPENANATPPANAVTSSATLENDFQQVVTGAGFFGCGIESQLESWYRFLVQPDPYASIAVSDNGSLSDGVATWQGVDQTILQQRADFLRPDSLVAIITLTDEDDSEIDVRSYSGTSWKFMSSGFDPPKGTQACLNTPTAAACGSCGFCGGSNAPSYCSDPNCAAGANTYSNNNDWGYNLNLRHVHMQQKYGANPQYPISRYVTGLTSTKVPDRLGEYPTNSAGQTAGSYVGNNDCTNPLFAAVLPDGSKTDQASLCDLTVGSRTPSLVFFAHIGGVPYQLLHFDPNSPKNSLLSASDWVKILGNDPDNYDYTGIDPHMVESQTPRPNVVAAPTTNLDPINGYDWTTNTGAAHVLPVDREYACIFTLPTPRDCSQPANSEACDCPATAASLSADELPPVCNPTLQTQQTGAKAYPTIRELNLAKKLGNQGIISSICPQHVTDQSSNGTDPLYGYRPAIAVIVNQLKNALATQCLPQQLTANADGTVPCLILATLPNAGQTCDPSSGLTAPDPTILQTFQQQQHATWVANGSTGTDPSTLTTCEVNQIVEQSGQTCKGGSTAGWCYVTGAAAGGTCSQAIQFGAGSPPSGSTVSLQCIEANTAGADGG